MNSLIPYTIAAARPASPGCEKRFHPVAPLTTGLLFVFQLNAIADELKT